MKHTKNLQKFINQPLSIARDKRIVFENTDTIFEEVSAQLKNFVAAPNTTYVAIYITPIPKTDKEHPQHNAYYKIKEQLLHKGISSQVVYREHLGREDFYYFMPNIYVALFMAFALPLLQWLLCLVNLQKPPMLLSKLLMPLQAANPFCFTPLPHCICP